ncbi:hypothetical protein [Eubacterium callanderi]|uniref:Phage protein n=1 Tax=Eubacterium callanderi TaxID=53442 RepID=E3GPF5_9FIRM|nr:hypothetical protein [Eubacterium callanderi]OEZ05804.1 hypothetical protein BUME_09010 [[Butyribacterium] methylotrophicum]ADO38076.1 hypothetical protein ELI_3107 [Eubacterium callanderi]MCB6660097.1 hypothetical protein [Eubacterium callanderi]MCB6753110.1 hypothetical protein [Eubacterium callanderi]MCB7104732.1 hypothetical protein [Eubacterium callanderi]
MKITIKDKEYDSGAFTIAKHQAVVKAWNACEGKDLFKEPYTEEQLKELSSAMALCFGLKPEEITENVSVEEITYFFYGIQNETINKFNALFLEVEENFTNGSDELPNELQPDN